MYNRAFVAVTSREWYEFLKQSYISGEVNFWRKNTNYFRALSHYEPLFFLVKNPPNVRGERAVLGVGYFSRFEELSPEEAWTKYKQGNGDPDFASFSSRMKEMFNVSKGTIGCIILSGLKFFDKPVKLSEIGISFKNSIVSGKSISSIEAKKVFDSSNTELFKSDLMEESLSFPEGKEMYMKHIVRERNSTVVDLAKERFKQKNGRLYCEVCGFDFELFYGEIGQGFIEGHHIVPVSELKEGDQTKVSDIVMVCSNCHRMLHRKRPWIKPDELIRLLH
ncbi:HNH endonuclease [Bacillaceae bacterium S4-13-58]